MANLKKKHEEELASKADKQEAEKKAVDDVQKENEAFWASLAESDDLTDNLTELTNYIHRNIKATGVYIGQLDPPMKPIKDDDDDTAHIDAEAPLVIKFKHANKDHEEFMIDAVLTNDQGIAHGLFREGEEEGEAEAAAEDEEDPDVKKVAKVIDILTTSKFKYIPEVVEEPKIHFMKVPRLGSFMAIPLVYNSCLFEASLDNAIEDWTEVSAQMAVQNEEKKEYDAEQDAIKEDRVKAGEEYVPEAREWPEIEAKPFDT